MVNYCNTEGCVLYRHGGSKLPNVGDIIVMDIDSEDSKSFEVIGIERYYETIGEPKVSPLGHETYWVKKENNYSVIMIPHEYDEEVGF